MLMNKLKLSQLKKKIKKSKNSKIKRIYVHLFNTSGGKEYKDKNRI